ncbi:MAG: hypothetical protein ACI92I_000418 [Acidimicrobiales bacterium]|jgi:hypothetical protein
MRYFTQLRKKYKKYKIPKFFIKRSRVLLIFLATVLLFVALIFTLAQKPVPEQIQYGMSFNTLYAKELDLNWKETYEAILNDLGVRHLRLAAHWPMIEPADDVFNFSELDYQVRRAEEVGADVILAVGRRLPRWPECHVPDWAKEMKWEEQQQQILDYITVVVNRYKDSPAITYWQIENEPYLEVFAKEHCGEFDEDFFQQEVEYFRSLDDTRPFLITDSGNLGKWTGPYKYGDAFGTSVYVHFWNPELGQFRTILPPWFYRVKENVMRLLYGDKETMLVELSTEPWLLEPIVEVDIETQYSRMDLEKIEDILEYAENTRYTKQYLWGAEWWYWLHKQGHSEIWQRGKELFRE